MELRAQSFLIEVRGTTPTGTLSVRLGYRGDRVADWLTGTTWPSAAEVLRLCDAQGTDVVKAFRVFDLKNPLVSLDERAVSAWLGAISRSTGPRAIGETIQRPSSVVRRWLEGRVRPRFPEFLAVVQAATGRSEELLQALHPKSAADAPVVKNAALAALARSSTLREQVRDALDAARAARGTAPDTSGPPGPAGTVAVEIEPTDDVPRENTVEVFPDEHSDPGSSELTQPDGSRRPMSVPGDLHPLAGAVWDAVASQDYLLLELHRPGWIAARLGLPADVERQCLEQLQAVGVLHRTDHTWHVVGPRPDLARPEPLAAEDLGVLGNLFRQRSRQVVLSVSQADVLRIRQLTRRTVPELGAIEAASHPKDTLLMVLADV